MCGKWSFRDPKIQKTISSSVFPGLCSLNSGSITKISQQPSEITFLLCLQRMLKRVTLQNHCERLQLLNYPLSVGAICLMFVAKQVIVQEQHKILIWIL